uniref:Uncharacterized protein n=1 Tax=Tanacetum cinerariifolium TaxID=118510 RepID=A0A699U2Q9_TANCI|nr:hypothetical protein [Tanacetum cinerariifolium]
MSLDDLYNHLKVYEAEVQTKSNSNSQNMAFISSSKNSSGNGDEMDIKWNMALLSIRADKFWKRTGKNISIQGSDVAGFENQKLSASTVTRWVISQESVEHLEVRKKEGKKAIDRGLKLKKRLQKH